MSSPLQPQHKRSSSSLSASGAGRSSSSKQAHHHHRPTTLHPDLRGNERWLDVDTKQTVVRGCDVMNLTVYGMHSDPTTVLCKMGATAKTNVHSIIAARRAVRRNISRRAYDVNDVKEARQAVEDRCLGAQTELDNLLKVALKCTDDIKACVR
eukprot:PhM_4_TR7037/c0_g1_i1/m.46041